MHAFTWLCRGVLLVKVLCVQHEYRNNNLCGMNFFWKSSPEGQSQWIIEILKMFIFPWVLPVGVMWIMTFLQIKDRANVYWLSKFKLRNGRSENVHMNIFNRICSYNAVFMNNVSYTHNPFIHFIVLVLLVMWKQHISGQKLVAENYHKPVALRLKQRVERSSWFSCCRWI